MSFGLSPSDVLKLLEISTRVYLAFRDANENSEAQVEGLVREFTTFHQCLVELDDLMKEYGKPLPFPYLDFKDTLQRCEKTIKPYSDNLVDKKMNFKKFTYTIRYIGKEKEIESLRKQITSHCQALQMSISFLQLRLNLEASKQTARLLDSAPFRAMSFGGQWYTSNALGSSQRAAPHALPAPEEEDQVFKDWVIFYRWIKSEHERLEQETSLTRPLSLGNTPALGDGATGAPSSDAESAAMFYHLERELDDIMKIRENRAKRAAIMRRNNLSPDDAMRQEVHNMPPMRTYTLDTEHSGIFSRFGNLSESTATIRPDPKTPSPGTSPAGSPQIPQSYFEPVNWSQSPASVAQSNDTGRASSISTHRTSISSRLSVSNIDPLTASTSPEDTLSHPLRPKLSATSLATIALGQGALDWNRLCRKVHVERVSTKGTESRECDVHWRYREDTGISIRGVYRSGKDVKVWTTQHFPATGPSIPLTTSYPDGDISIDFPRGSFGRLEKHYTDIKYICSTSESSAKLQTLLYTNNGKDNAELLFDRPIHTISSNLNVPECRAKNIRLWRRTEVHGPEIGEALVVLFYTSALQENKAHWVEEPHYAFQWLDESVYKKSSDKLTLTFSKDPGKWNRDKLFKRRTSSKSSISDSPATNIQGATAIQSPNSPSLTQSPPATPNLARSGTLTSLASTTHSLKSSSKSIFGSTRNMTGNINRFGYSELEIRFQSKGDRRDFLEIWRGFVKKLGEY